jgi:hypothetical protein
METDRDWRRARDRLLVGAISDRTVAIVVVVCVCHLILSGLQVLTAYESPLFESLLGFAEVLLVMQVALRLLLETTWLLASFWVEIREFVRRSKTGADG